MNYVLLVVIILIALVILWIAATYNSLVRKRNQCREAYSTMDVCLKKRFDLIPNLVETVKGFAKHETETLQAVTSARTMVSQARNVGERLQGENALTDTLRQLFAVAEQYPDLKANMVFSQLQQQLSDVETDIANSRKYYNGSVREMNNRIETFPSNLIAHLFGFQPWLMFEADSPQMRQNVQVRF